MDLTLRHTGRRRFTRALVALGAGALSLGAVAACGGSNALGSASSSASAGAKATASSATGGGAGTGGGSGRTITVGGADFSEQLLLTQIYSQALQGAGFTVKPPSNVSSREIYLAALRSGQIDVVPEYAATLTSSLADSLKTPATPSADVARTVATLRPLAAKAGLTVLTPSAATDQNTFVVSQAYATKNNLKTLSDLGRVGGSIRIAAGAECSSRPFCAPGLEKTYGIRATVDPTGAGAAPSFQAVKNGTDQLALAFTSDGTYKSFGLVELADDKHLQASDNVVAVVNTRAVGSDPKVAQTLDAVDAALTTADLQTLNARIGNDREQPAAVAKAWLASKNLS